MKKIAIFTTSRADFGVISALIREIEKTSDIECLLFVGGTHLTYEHGRTISEIRKDHKIDATFDFFLNVDNEYTLSRSVGIATMEIATIFNNYEFDFVCITGDRFELLSIVTNAIIFRKPIIHLNGGEITQGAIDEQVRHMITKASHIHFVSCNEYWLNVRKMGESEWRIYNTGALSIDNIVNNCLIAKIELVKDLNIDLNKDTILLTYHPVTLEFALKPFDQIKNIFEALKKFDFQVIITAPNIDKDREIIFSYIQDEVDKNSNYHFVESLGAIRYYSLIQLCKFVIGNSSSGIVEVPYFKIPTINIGDRQKGRVRHSSVIDTDYDVESISKGIEKALSDTFLKSLHNMKCKFGEGDAATKIVEFIKKIKIDEKLMRKELDFLERL